MSELFFYWLSGCLMVVFFAVGYLLGKRNG